MVLAVLFNKLSQHAREIRKFILLPWHEKKKKAHEFWQKYCRIYIILFILATIVAFINVYIETRSHDKIGKVRKSLIGGNGTDKNKLSPDTSNSNTEQVEDNKSSLKTELPTSNTQPGTNQKPGTGTKPGNNGKPSTTNTANETLAENKQQKQNITVSTSVITSTQSSNKVSKLDEIKARRKAKAAERGSKTSIQDSLSSLGNNLTAGVSEGTGKALSVLGTFFSAILGLLLFCCAPVVIFYLWMKKLIMPLFPTSKQN